MHTKTRSVVHLQSLDVLVPPHSLNVLNKRVRYTDTRCFLNFQYIPVEVGKPKFVRQDVRIQELRVYIPDYKPYSVSFRGSTLGNIVCTCYLFVLSHCVQP